MQYFLNSKNIRSWLVTRHAQELLVVFSIQAFSLLAAVAISLIITNLLGAAAYGVFSYGFSWVNLLAVFSCMGFEQLALKEIPTYQAQGRKDLMHGYFRYATKKILLISVIVSILLFLISWLLQQPDDNLLRTGFWLAIPVLPVIAMINLRLSWLRSFHLNSLSQFPDKLIRPLVFLVMLLIAFLIYGRELNIFMVIIMSGISIIVALAVGNYFVQKKVLSTVAEVIPLFEKQKWTKIAFSLLMVNGIYFYLSQLQILMLGSFKGAVETGIFAIASRLSDLEGYMLFALNVVLAPIISRLFAEEKMAELQSVITRTLWFGFLFSLPVIISFLLLPSFFLGFFGDEFGSGRNALIVLTLSQVVNFATGSVGYMLTMTGHHKTAIQLLVLTAALTTLLSFLLIPAFGINGAAVSAAVNNIVLNVLMAIAVYKKTGINSTLLRFR
ncbi:MAG: oligosaccharide flippase family protein [Chitinophagales bacterium]|nr:oligosaccharide flippase family protein [Chitinophagales bacterium]